MAIYFTFWKGESFFALPIEFVEGVSRLEELIPADWGPEWLTGFTFFRGQVVPLVDLERYMGHNLPPVSARYVVVSRSKELLGFGATRLGAHYETEEGPEPLEEARSGLKGQLLLGGRTALVIDPPGILEEGGER